MKNFCWVNKILFSIVGIIISPILWIIVLRLSGNIANFLFEILYPPLIIFRDNIPSFEPVIFIFGPVYFFLYGVILDWGRYVKKFISFAVGLLFCHYFIIIFLQPFFLKRAPYENKATELSYIAILIFLLWNAFVIFFVIKTKKTILSAKSLKSQYSDQIDEKDKLLEPSFCNLSTKTLNQSPIKHEEKDSFSSRWSFSFIGLAISPILWFFSTGGGPLGLNAMSKDFFLILLFYAPLIPFYLYLIIIIPVYFFFPGLLLDYAKHHNIKWIPILLFIIHYLFFIPLVIVYPGPLFEGWKNPNKDEDLLLYGLFLSIGLLIFFAWQAYIINYFFFKKNFTTKDSVKNIS